MKRKIIISIILLTVLSIGFYGFFIEPEMVEITHLYVNNMPFSKVLKGKIGIQLSDLHIAKEGKYEKRILKIIDDINPDFIFLTGDYVKWDGDYKPALDFLSHLKARYGVWAVMGEYDYSNSRKSCLFCHEKGSGQLTKRYSVKFLRNNKVYINLPEGHITLGGIDIEHENDVKGIDGAEIVLSHSPLAFDDINENRQVLVLSGDTHGGQIPLPGWLWALLGYEKNARYNHGLYKVGKKVMYVSRGIGTSHIHFRLFERPEIVVLHF